MNSEVMLESVDLQYVVDADKNIDRANGGMVVNLFLFYFFLLLMYLDYFTCTTL